MLHPIPNRTPIKETGVRTIILRKSLIRRIKESSRSKMRFFNIIVGNFPGWEQATDLIWQKLVRLSEKTV